MTNLRALFSFILLGLAYVGSVAGQQNKKNCDCLNDKDVDTILKDFATVIRTAPGYTRLAERRLVKDFTAVSDSYAYINREPLNGTVCRTRDLFITFVEPDWTQHGPIDTLFSSYTCDTITWYNTVTAYPENGVKTPVRGIDILKINKGKRVTNIFREQNTAAQLYALYPDSRSRPDCKRKWKPINGKEGTKRTSAKCGRCQKA
ncbi:hypothetical protein Slin14017_G068760 [Septoria linicola]|nr:hypothetical protein Slin14017_G068760 [Septoria linicola]